jgi:DNA gyrase/topoisomerase IV subunit A
MDDKIMEKQTITEIIDGEYLDFAMYVLESRAIPSVIDGLKPVQRKILYAMLSEHGGKKVKINDLGSIAKHNYHHGETSAMAAAIGMSANWSNNSPLFTQHGNFGSRLVQDAAAPRYIYSSLSEVYKKIFIDLEVAPKSFDIENPEPAFYLPIIPWILINGIGGIAVGFKTEILPRSISDVITATKQYLKNPQKFLETDALIPPTFPNFKGNVIVQGTNQWKTQGIIKYVGKNYYEISELPIGYDRETYVTFLNDLCDKELIRDYEDDCSKEGFGFMVKVSIAQKEAIDKDPHKYFKLEKTHTEILTTMGVDGKLKIFNSVAELIGYFCDYRLLKFQDKINYDIEKLKHDIVVLKDKIKFINDVINDQIDFKTTKKQGLLFYIETNITPLEHGKRFIHIPLYECTIDAVLELYGKIKVCHESLSLLEKSNSEETFKNNLASIKI